MKKIIYLLTLVLSWLAFASPVNAAEASVTDDAGLFTTAEINELNQLAGKLNQEIKGDVFILTTTQDYNDPETFTDDFLREKVGNDNNGAVLMVNMNYRDYHISTSGNMIDYITDSRLDTLKEAVENNLSNGNYFQAAQAFLEQSSTYVADGVPGRHYRVDRETGKINYYKVLTPLEIILALIAAAVISLIVFFVVKSKYQLKLGSYHYPYNEKSSLKLVQKQDRLTNSFVTTRRIPRNTSSGGGGGGGGSTTHSSGGGTFGGGGGKF